MKKVSSTFPIEGQTMRPSGPSHPRPEGRGFRPRGPGFSIAIKLVFIMAVILFFTLSALAAGVYCKSRNILKDQIFKDFSLLARSKSGQITELLEIELERALLVAARVAIKRGLEEIGEQDYVGEKGLSELFLALEVLKDAIPSLKQLVIADARGRIAASTHAPDIGKNFSGEPWFSAGKEKPSFVGMTLAGKEAFYEISCPVLSLKGRKVIGVVRMIVKADKLFDILGDRAGLGKTGEWVLVKRQGPDFLFLNPLRHDPDAAFKRILPAHSSRAYFMNKAMEGQVGIAIGPDYIGHEVLAAHAHVPLSGWGFIAKIDVREAFAPIGALFLQTIFFGVLIFLASLASAYFFAKKISAPIKKLREAAVAVAGGQLDVQVSVDSQDEIGHLAAAFNQMVSKRIVDDIRKDNEHLKSVDALKSHFVIQVSHDFRSPLAVIKDAVSLVLEGECGPVTAQQKEMLVIAKRHADRLVRLVTDLLELSRIEAGKTPLEKQNIDIGSLVGEIVKDYEREFLKKQLSVRLEVASGVGSLWADKDKLSEVVINLLDNAMKYTPAGGAIDIKLTGIEGVVRFEIADSGPGIAKENLEKIFDKFERISAEKQEGTGLGLTITKDIVELHQGKIWAESELGKGSRFIFVLPRDLRKSPPDSSLSA